MKKSIKGTTLDSPKTESSNRDIPMMDNVYRILKSHRIEQQKMKLYLGDRWVNDFPDLVFQQEEIQWRGLPSLPFWIRDRKILDRGTSNRSADFIWNGISGITASGCCDGGGSGGYYSVGSEESGIRFLTGDEQS